MGRMKSVGQRIWGELQDISHLGHAVEKSFGAPQLRQVRFAMDSALEQSGFEPLVPPTTDTFQAFAGRPTQSFWFQPESGSHPTHRWRKLDSNRWSHPLLSTRTWHL